MGKLFPFKDNIKEKHAQSLVVYRLTCETCKQTYIGKTERILAHRIKEHPNPKKTRQSRHTYKKIQHMCLTQKTSKYWIKPSATLKSDLKKNFTSSRTSLNSIANMQLHTKENTIGYVQVHRDPNNITDQLERLYVHYYQHTSLTL